MVRPEREPMTSPGRALDREMRFSQAGITAVTFTAAPDAARARTAMETAAAPAISPLMPSIESLAFRE